jgi:GTP cyclohydrolase I
MTDLAEVTVDDVEIAERGIEALLRLMDPDPGRESLVRTPTRVLRGMLEFVAQADTEVDDLLLTRFDENCDEIVLVGPIRFISLCEHHLLPFVGTGHIGYIPADGKVIGLSKLPRLLDHFARRPQMQERLTRQVADAFEEHVKPLGVGVVLRAQHSCLTLRGARKQEAEMVTSAMRGVFRTKPEARAELMALVRL